MQSSATELFILKDGLARHDYSGTTSIREKNRAFLGIAKESAEVLLESIDNPCKVKIDRSKLRPLWKKGTAAHGLGERADRVIRRLTAQSKMHLSLRESCRVLEVSHHTLSEWEKRKLIKRSVQTGKFFISDLRALVEDMKKYGEQVLIPPAKEARLGPRNYRFQIIGQSSFAWERDEKELTPSEVARRIGCHQSTIIRAIREKIVPARRKTPCRYMITRAAWLRRYPTTVVSASKFLPRR